MRTDIFSLIDEKDSPNRKNVLTDETFVIAGGTVEQIVQLCADGVLKPFVDLLAAKVQLCNIAVCILNKRFYSEIKFKHICAFHKM